MKRAELTDRKLAEGEHGRLRLADLGAVEWYRAGLWSLQAGWSALVLKHRGEQDYTWALFTKKKKFHHLTNIIYQNQHKVTGQK